MPAAVAQFTLNQRSHSIRRMWTGGPTRRWSPIRESGCIMPLAAGGFGGAYVCDECAMPVTGVYRVIDRVQRQQTWLCGGCRAREVSQ
jgi:hypothetical protein